MNPRWILVAAFAAWTLFIWKDASLVEGASGSNALHLVLLPFHEAGHVLLIWAGQFLRTLGGTLGQLAMPIVCGAALWKRKDRFGAALCAWLLGYSILDMAVYMFDAFDPHLVLLGGLTGQESDGHDWQNLFGDMGLLKRARGIGRFFAVVGDAVMVAALAYAAIALRRPQADDDGGPNDAD